MFKVVWDAKYNGVRLTMSAAGEALNVSHVLFSGKSSTYLGSIRWDGYTLMFMNRFFGLAIDATFSKGSLCSK